MRQASASLLLFLSGFFNSEQGMVLALLCWALLPLCWLAFIHAQSRH